MNKFSLGGALLAAIIGKGALAQDTTNYIDVMVTDLG